MNVVAYDPYVPDSKFERLNVKRAATLSELLGQVGRRDGAYSAHGRDARHDR